MTSEEDDILRYLNNTSGTNQGRNFSNERRGSKDSLARMSYLSNQLQRENQRLKVQLEYEKRRTKELEEQLTIIQKEHLSYQEQLEEKIASLGQQLSDLMAKSVGQDQVFDSYESLQEKLQKAEEVLEEKNQQLQKYEQLGEQMLETENYIDKVIAEKDQREEELLNKMSVIASHYHQEKEKNIKMLGEIQRQNEILERLDQHTRVLHTKNVKGEETIDKLRDELARGKVVVNQNGYSQLVNKIANSTENSAERMNTCDSEQSPNRRSREIQNRRREQRERTPQLTNKQDTLSNILKPQNLYNQFKDDVVNWSYTNNKRLVENKVEVQRIEIQRVVDKEERQKQLEDYNQQVLKNLQIKAMRINQDKRSNDENKNMLERRRNLIDMNKIEVNQVCSINNQDSIPQDTDCQSIQESTINLEEVQQEAFKDLTNYQPPLTMSFSQNNYNQSKQIVQEIKSAKTMMEQIEDFNQKRENITNRLREIDQNILTP